MGDHEIRAYYDPDIDLLRIELPHDGEPLADEQLGRDVLMEVEPDGAPLVLEVLRASEHYPTEWLKAIPNAPDEPPRLWSGGPRSFRSVLRGAVEEAD